MAVYPYTDQETLEAFQRYGSKRKAAKQLGVDRATFRNHLASALTSQEKKEGEFVVADLPSKNLSVSELIARRKQQFEQLKKAKLARKLIPVKINQDGPIGIAHFGDPHVDDNGTDIQLLEDHIKIVQRTPGLFAGNIGDTTNNWMGRLAHLYSEESVSAAEAWILAEWFIKELPWLYVLGGNHDAWSGEGDPLKWITTHALYEPASARLCLQFPNKVQVRVNARHDFKGFSMWNAAHGAAKAIQMGWRDHIVICGHQHTSGYNILKCPATGLVSHAIRVPSYKIYDKFGQEQLGLPDQNISACVTTVIDPYAKTEAGLVTVLQDLETAADFLTFLRKKRV